MLKLFSKLTDPKFVNMMAKHKIKVLYSAIICGKCSRKVEMFELGQTKTNEQ